VFSSIKNFGTVRVKEILRMIAKSIMNVILYFHVDDGIMEQTLGFWLPSQNHYENIRIQKPKSTHRGYSSVPSNPFWMPKPLRIRA